MSRVTQLLRLNRISLNIAKAEITLFRSYSTKSPKSWVFKKRDRKINTKTHAKYLGQILDEHLNFKKQIDKGKQKIERVTILLPSLDIMHPKRL